MIDRETARLYYGCREMKQPMPAQSQAFTASGSDASVFISRCELLSDHAETWNEPIEMRDMSDMSPSPESRKLFMEYLANMRRDSARERIYDSLIVGAAPLNHMDVETRAFG